MKINWKVRFMHKPFLLAMFSLVLLLVQQVGAVFGYDVTNMMGEQLTAIFHTVLSILVLIGVVVDPTTKGTSDSEQAQMYREPK